MRPTSEGADCEGMVLDKDRAVFYPFIRVLGPFFKKQAGAFLKEVHNGTKRGRHHEGKADDVDRAGHQARR